MYRTREELLEAIALIFENRQADDPNDGWDADMIADDIWGVLTTEDNVMSDCGECGYASRAHLDECPFAEYHACEDCGEYIAECECEDDEPTPVEQLEIDSAPSTQVCVGCHHMLNDCVCPKVTAG